MEPCFTVYVPILTSPKLEAALLRAPDINIGGHVLIHTHTHTTATIQTISSAAPPSSVVQSQALILEDDGDPGGRKGSTFGACIC